jgi:AraC family transcriptional regulator
MLKQSRLLKVGSAAFVRGHDHDSPHFCAVISGALFESNNRGTNVLRALDVRLSPPAKRDLQFGNLGASCLIAELDAECGEIPNSVYATAPAWTSAVLRDLETAKTCDSARWSLDADLAVGDIVGWLSSSRLKRVPPRWLLRVRDSVRECGTLDAQQLAAEAGVHRVHLSRSFREHFGMPLSVYVQRVRALRAVHLLRQPELALAQVADRAGYFDQAHFSRSIARFFGRPPSVLRTMLPAYKTGGSFPV